HTDDTFFPAIGRKRPHEKDGRLARANAFHSNALAGGRGTGGVALLPGVMGPKFARGYSHRAGFCRSRFNRLRENASFLQSSCVLEYPNYNEPTEYGSKEGVPDRLYPVRSQCVNKSKCNAEAEIHA